MEFDNAVKNWMQRAVEIDAFEFPDLVWISERSHFPWQAIAVKDE
jgi:hypothetical protein